MSGPASHPAPGSEPRAGQAAAAAIGNLARIGIDLGGTKIEGILIGRDGEEISRLRIPAPRDSYDNTLSAIRSLVMRLQPAAGAAASVGLGMPGSISPATGLAQNANSTWLNGRPFHRDLERVVGQPVRVANDANCFALSEAVDGAGAGKRVVLGIILGTGIGGGIVVDRVILDGPRGTGGEWGHNPLPWPEPDEFPGPECWCGRRGCIEAWASGPGLAAAHARATGMHASPEEIVAAATAGDAAARSSLERHASRIARALAALANIVDPHVIVIGGGLSKLEHLYQRLPLLMRPFLFGDSPDIDIRRPHWGDAGGVRGAAWLWTDN